jgi:hypothetical protein
MPYWSIHCPYCHGYITDALLECLPAAKRTHPGYTLLFQAQPGAALACPYCNRAFGFEKAGTPQAPASGWPIFRYSRVQLEVKKQADGELPTTPLAVWALTHRFTQPGTQQPLIHYTYAEQAPPDETVP